MCCPGIYLSEIFSNVNTVFLPSHHCFLSPSLPPHWAYLKQHCKADLLSEQGGQLEQNYLYQAKVDKQDNFNNIVYHRNIPIQAYTCFKTGCLPENSEGKQIISFLL